MQNVKETLINYIKENEDKFYRIAFSYSENEEATLDIVQESIVKSLNHINKLKNEEYVKTWFYRILINECLQYIKKNKRIITYESQEIENKIEWNDDISINGIDMYKYIQGLNKKLRTVIILRYFEDMKIEEIAKIFTVKEVKEEDSTKLINAKIPALENTGNTDLERRINYEIMLKINEILEEAEERAAEYKNVFLQYRY